MSESTYDQWAEVYDSVYAYVTDDIPFYVEEARQSGGPVLELGCGTGRVAIPIAQAGVHTVGLDFSPNMLDVAGRKLQAAGVGKKLTLIRGDMRDFSLDQAFKLVTIPFRGFLALLTVEDQMKTLDSIGRHLAPDGRLVFNIFAPDPHTLLREGDVPLHHRDVTDPETGTRMVLYDQSRFDNHNQIIDVRQIAEELDEAGAVSRKLYWDFQLRYAHRWEIEHLLARCGYEVIDLFGDFDRSPFDETSTEMVWVARPAQG